MEPSVYLALNDKELRYPRVCAHRGFRTLVPENTLASYGAAIAMGAVELELDVWPTADGELVVFHDEEIDMVTTGKGRIVDHTLAQLEELDFGAWYDPTLRGLKILKFEEVLKRFACGVVMNVHVKPLSYTEDYPEEAMKKIVSVIRKYGAEKHTYFMLETDFQIKQFKAYAPEIAICVGHLQARPYAIVDRAIALGCEKVQLCKPYFNQEMIDRAHAHGIICNMFFSDEEDETEQFLNMGIDTILTNDYFIISEAVKRLCKNRA